MPIGITASLEQEEQARAADTTPAKEEGPNELMHRVLGDGDVLLVQNLSLIHI